MNLNKEFEKELEKALNKKMLKMKEALVLNTPIDTGNAREQWRIDGNKLVNDADYIDELNAGSSQQAPVYFIEKTLLAQEGVKPNGTIVKSK
jgi:hypothetical protein